MARSSPDRSRMGTRLLMESLTLSHRRPLGDTEDSSGTRMLLASPRLDDGSYLGGHRNVKPLTLGAARFALIGPLKSFSECWRMKPTGPASKPSQFKSSSILTLTT